MVDLLILWNPGTKDWWPSDRKWSETVLQKTNVYLFVTWKVIIAANLLQINRSS